MIAPVSPTICEWAARASRVRRGGFTLLETLVALAILGLGVTSMLQLMGTSSRNAARASATTTAVFAAEELMEELSTLGESELRQRSGEAGDWAARARASESRRLRLSRERGAGAVAYTYAVRVAPVRSEVGLYRVDVAVAWPDPGRGRVELTTLHRFARETADELQP